MGGGLSISWMIAATRGWVMSSLQQAASGR
jgi:hypothetical protein